MGCLGNGKGHLSHSTSHTNNTLITFDEGPNPNIEPGGGSCGGFTSESKRYFHGKHHKRCIGNFTQYRNLGGSVENHEPKTNISANILL